MEAFTKFKFNKDNMTDTILREGLMWIRQCSLHTDTFFNTLSKGEVTSLAILDSGSEFTRQQLFNCMTYVAKAIEYQEKYITTDMEEMKESRGKMVESWRKTAKLLADYYAFACNVSSRGEYPKVQVED
jgi:hypothetical protein